MGIVNNSREHLLQMKNITSHEMVTEQIWSWEQSHFIDLLIKKGLKLSRLFIKFSVYDLNGNLIGSQKSEFLQKKSRFWFPSMERRQRVGKGRF